MKISVALAAYNGEKYIEKQLESILKQLRSGDEVIVSDDCPSSAMSDLVKSIVNSDARVKYIEGPSKGVIKNFENAIKNSTGDVIFLCDQDDVWLDDKVQSVMKEIENGADLVLHDAIVTDANLNHICESFFEKHKSKLGLLNNIFKNSYMGCCMAFKSEIKASILPFPNGLPMHDQWIGLIAEKKYKVKLLNKPLILYRVHGENVTGGKTKLTNKIKWRINICKNLLRK
ncbi:MAG: glycosyltransferase family 2 protein [Clostridia bacterium]|nr:glycosyltransferase family 2 protein [Clostridia bacterium]